MSNPNAEIKDAIERLLRVHMLLNAQRYYSRALLSKLSEAERVSKSNVEKIARAAIRIVAEFFDTECPF